MTVHVEKLIERYQKRWRVNKLGTSLAGML